MKLNLDVGECWMEAKYAPTGKATCKRCGCLIDKGQLRMTNIEDDDHWRSEMHYHGKCFRKKPYFFGAFYSDVFGVESLKKKDQLVVLKYFSMNPDKQKREQEPKAESCDLKSNGEIDSDSDFVCEEVKSFPTSKQQIPLKQTRQQKRSESRENQDPDYFCLYNEIQKHQFRKFEKEMSKKDVTKLRQLLKKNDQKLLGKKKELIERIADCKIQGCLKKCPNCKKETPVMDSTTKLFKCPGNKEKLCCKQWKPTDLIRIPWKE